jgi:coenzyme F420 hydrogenase subunit beta
LQEAVEGGYLKLKRVDPAALPQSQKSLLNRRCHLWGRLFVMKLMCIPIPKYTGFSLFKNWLTLTAIEKLRSFCGTLRRIIVRGWMRPLKKLRLNSLHQTNITDNYLINPKESESKCKA